MQLRCFITIRAGSHSGSVATMATMAVHKIVAFMMIILMIVFVLMMFDIDTGIGLTVDTVQRLEEMIIVGRCRPGRVQSGRIVSRRVLPPATIITELTIVHCFDIATFCTGFLRAGEAFMMMMVLVPARAGIDSA